MTYLIPTRKTNIGHTHSKYKLIIIFLGLLFFALIFFSILNPAFNIFSFNVRNFFEKTPIFEYFRLKSSLISENNSLKNEVNNLVAENADRKILTEENTHLKELLGRVGKENFIYAKVLVRPGYSPYDTFVLDAGEDQGVKSGEKIFYKNLAIGEISEIKKEQSSATLFSSSGKTFKVLVGDKKIESEAEGQGGGSFLIQVPKGVKVEEGDMVVSPDSSGVLGLVSAVFSDQAETFQKVYFSLPINIYEIGDVLIKKE